MSPNPLAKFEIQNYYQNEHKIYGVYPRNNLCKKKDKINLDEQESIETRCIDLYVNDNNVIHFKFLLAGDGFMPDMHLRQPGFTCSACGSFTKNKERKTIIKKQKIRVIFVKTNQIKPVSNMR